MKQIILLFILFLCLLSSSIFAQKNRIEINMGGYKMYNVVGYDHSIKNSVGIIISRKISKKISIELGYRLPGAWAFYYDRDMATKYRPLCGEEIVDSYSDTGKLIERDYYHYFDAGIRYELLSAKNQTLSFRQNFSLAYGTNVYLTTLGALWISPAEPFHVVTANYERKKEVQFGGVTGVAYDYHVWKNRINIGFDVAARYYTHSFPFQLNYGLHLGYNF